MDVQARAPSDQPDTATVDDRIIAVMRFALALSALLITIIDSEDAGANGSTPAPFTPRSIDERAAALGGWVHVDPRDDGGSAVVIEIPL
jgi:hypothetical protein